MAGGSAPLEPVARALLSNTSLAYQLTLTASPETLMKNALYKAAAMAALFTLTTACAQRSTPETPAAQQSTAEIPAMKTIVQTAVDAGSFTTLVAAVQAAGLVETLSGPGPFTVFAPTDAAFAKLPEGTVAGLLKDKAQLASILTFHVLAGTVMAGDVIQANGAKPNTVNGLPLDIVVRGGKVYVNGAQVESADIVASNGVIHVIDSVLLPGAAPATAGR